MKPEGDVVDDFERPIDVIKASMGQVNAPRFLDINVGSIVDNKESVFRFYL